MAAKKFARAVVGRGSATKKDDKGKVRIVVSLMDPKGGPKKGNLSRSLTVDQAKVSEVIKAIEESLF